MTCTSQPPLPARKGWSSSALSGAQPPSVFGLGLERLVLQWTAADVIAMIRLLLAKELMTCPVTHITSSSVRRSAASSLARLSAPGTETSIPSNAGLPPAPSQPPERAGRSRLASALHTSVTFPSRSCRDVSCSPASRMLTASDSAFVAKNTTEQFAWERSLFSLAGSQVTLPRSLQLKLLWAVLM